MDFSWLIYALDECSTAVDRVGFHEAIMKRQIGLDISETKILKRLKVKQYRSVGFWVKNIQVVRY